MLQSEDIDAIETMVAALRDAPHLTEIELRCGDRTLFLRRPVAPPSPAQSQGRPTASPAAVRNGAGAESATNGVSPASTNGVGGVEEAATEAAGVYATAHLVGIFRAGRKPVTPGDTVQEKQVLGQIEAMRLMNDVVSPASGHIAAALVRDGQPVEYGQSLFEIMPE